MKNVIPMSAAMEEVEKWLEYKKVKPSKREEYADNIEEIAECISLGIITYDEKTNELKHNLQFPLENDKGESMLSELVYKPRIRVKETKPHMKGVKTGDSDGRVMAYLCAVTNQNRMMLENLDYSDYSISSSIVVFFF